MMRYLLFAMFFSMGVTLWGQSEAEIVQDIKDYQESKNEEFRNPETTILWKRNWCVRPMKSRS